MNIILVSEAERKCRLGVRSTTDEGIVAEMPGIRQTLEQNAQTVTHADKKAARCSQI